MRVYTTVRVNYDFKNEYDEWVPSKCVTISPKNYETVQTLSGGRWFNIKKL